jgi:hypothetical protein
MEGLRTTPLRNSSLLLSKVPTSDLGTLLDQSLPDHQRIGDPASVTDLDTYLEHIALLSPRHQCSLAAALISQQRIDDGVRILNGLVGDLEAMENRDPEDPLLADAMLNLGIALSAQRMNGV